MSTHTPGGLLVVVDGIDGAGKTTLARALAEGLLRRGKAVAVSKEPTTGQWGMILRESAAAGRLTPDQELEYLVKDRREHVRDFIRPALDRGEVVILDRYFPSTIAYQGAAGIPLPTLLDANDFAPRPDLFLLLDVHPEIGLARIRARGDKPNHFETVETLTRCREIFQGLSLDGRVVIDASQSAEDVLARAQLHLLLALIEKLKRVYGSTPEAALAVAEYLPSLQAAAGH